MAIPTMQQRIWPEIRTKRPTTCQQTHQNPNNTDKRKTYGVQKNTRKRHHATNTTTPFGPRTTENATTTKEKQEQGQTAKTGVQIPPYITRPGNRTYQQYGGN